MFSLESNLVGQTWPSYSPTVSHLSSWKTKIKAIFPRFLARKVPGCTVHNIARLHKVQSFMVSINWLHHLSSWLSQNTQIQLSWKCIKDEVGNWCAPLALVVSWDVTINLLQVFAVRHYFINTGFLTSSAVYSFYWPCQSILMLLIVTASVEANVLSLAVAWFNRWFGRTTKTAKVSLWASLCHSIMMAALLLKWMALICFYLLVITSMQLRWNMENAEDEIVINKQCDITMLQGQWLKFRCSQSRGKNGVQHVYSEELKNITRLDSSVNVKLQKQGQGWLYWFSSVLQSS